MAALMRCFLAVWLFPRMVAVVTTPSDPLDSVLQKRLQEALDLYIAECKEKNLSVSAQVGWRSSTDSFTVAAGESYPSASRASHRVQANDTFLYGSGTKPFTAAAVMRLIEQGKVDANVPAAKYIDPFLQANNGTTLAEIFGKEVMNATAMDLIRMSAGIPDFEKGDYDNRLLMEGNRVWPVYENIHYAASYQASQNNPCATVQDCECNSDAPGWCSNNQCYAGRADGRCVNKTNGFSLGDDNWCWNGELNHRCTSKYSKPLLCSPGNCSSYSSASYELAGLLVAALEVPNGAYTDMDLGKYAFGNRIRYPTLTFPPVTSEPGASNLTTAKLSDHLTVTGNTFGMFGDAIIADQNPSILGWTCGHMIGTAGDVATFFYDLFDSSSEHRILNDTSLKEMTRLTPLTTGWSTGMYYGAGLMPVANNQNRSHWPSPGEWGWSMGHGGMTYGFASFQGYDFKARAGWSVVTNVGNNYFASRISCLVSQIAAGALAGEDAHLNCSTAVTLDLQDRVPSPSPENEVPVSHQNREKSFFV